MPSRGVSAPTAAHKTIVSPYRITHDPSACLATRPTSTVRSRSPTLIDSFRYFLTVILVRLLLTMPAGSADTQRLIRCDFYVQSSALRRLVDPLEPPEGGTPNAKREGGRAWP